MTSSGPPTTSRSAPAQSAPWVGERRNPAAAVDLFCFPYAGGGASSYHEWRGRLPSVEVVPVQLPGREDRFVERPFVRMDELVEALLAVLAPRLDRPFAFFGHSMGAVIGFELARRLRREGEPQPAWLFVSGSLAPQARVRPRPRLSGEELVRRLRTLGGTPPAVLANPELLELVLPVLEADFELIDGYGYRPEPPLRCGIHAFGGTEDTEARPHDLEAWRAQSEGPFALDVLPGDHFFLTAHAEAILAAIAADLRPLVAAPPADDGGTSR